MEPRINVSEIANFIRLTKWAKSDIVDTFENIWKRTNPQSYKSSRKRQTVREINQFIKDNALQPIEVSTDTRMTHEEVPQLEQEYSKIVDHVEEKQKADLIKDIAKVDKNVKGGKITAKEAKSIKRALLKESKIDTSEVKSNMDSEQMTEKLKRAKLENRAEIDKYYGGVSKQTLGICEELTVVEKYHKITGRTIEENNSEIFRKKYKTRKGRIFQVSGKVDGFAPSLDGERHLIEIKNRTKRLFNFIPNYERTQVLFYMAMTKTTNGELIERFGDEIKIHPFDFDKDRYKDTLKILSRYVDFLVDFLEMPQLIEEYQQMSHQERGRFLNGAMDQI